MYANVMENVFKLFKYSVFKFDIEFSYSLPTKVTVPH